MKKLFQLVCMSLLVFAMASTTACKKEECEQDYCLNGGAWFDCQCQCPTGFSGENCQIDNSTPTATSPPVASFSFSPSTVIADQTAVTFSNQSTGAGNTYEWDFGAGEGTSSETNPTHVFKKEHHMAVQVKLTVTNAAGSDVATKNFEVFAMDPNLHNYGNYTTHSTGSILLIRNNNYLETGNLLFQNNYGGDVKVELFHSDDWLAGTYTPFGNVHWNVVTNLPNYTNFTYNGGSFIIGNDWGIRVSFTNGVTSCVRTIDKVSTYNSGKFYVKASDVYEGL